MADKDKLASLLGGEPPPPRIRRGAPVRLSTEGASTTEAQERTSASPQSSGNAGTQNSEIAEAQERRSARTQSEPKRVNRGYMLREDLIKDIKRLALEEDRKLYEVMEEALEEYLARRKAG